MKRLSIIRKKIEKLILNKNWKMIAAGEVKLELAFFTDFGSFTTSSMQNQYHWLRRKPIFQPLRGPVTSKSFAKDSEVQTNASFLTSMGLWSRGPDLQMLFVTGFAGS